MLVRKFIPLAVFAGIFTSPAAQAGSIAFTFSGNNSDSTWSWVDGAGALDATAYSATVGKVGSHGLPINGDVEITFTSGPELGGDGSLRDPYRFGPGGDIVIMGCIPGQGTGCGTLYLFRGEFQAEMAFAGDGSLAFDAPNISGTINPVIASLFGIPSVNLLGSFDALLNCATDAHGCTIGSGGLVGCADLVLIPGGGCDDHSPSGSCDPSVPEPDSLTLIAVGSPALLVAIAARRLARP
jgi:hypothetical protein